MSIVLAQNVIASVRKQCIWQNTVTYGTNILVFNEDTSTVDVTGKKFNYLKQLYTSQYVEQGEVAIIDCHMDYTLIGPSRLSCISAPDGSAVWDKSFPECRKNVCRWLGRQDESLIQFHYSGHRLAATSNHFPEGTILTYLPGAFRCSPGYATEPLSTASCSSNGNWIGQRPRCSKDPNACAWHGPKENVMFQFNGESLPVNATFFSPETEMTSLKPVDCPPDYSFVGHLVQVCENGSWTVKKYPCEPLATNFCEWNGSTDYVKFYRNGNELDRKFNKFPDGTRATEQIENVTCPSGCTAKKTSLKICMARQWVTPNKNSSTLAANGERAEAQCCSCIGSISWGISMTLFCFALVVYILKPLLFQDNCLKNAGQSSDRTTTTRQRNNRPIGRRVSIVHHTEMTNAPVYHNVEKRPPEQADNIYSDITTPEPLYSDIGATLSDENDCTMYAAVVPKSKR